MKNLRLWFPVTGLAALMAAGCMLLSGQFVITYEFADHGFDPVTVTSPTDLLGVQVNLNEVSEYRDHRENLVAVDDMALLGKLTNLTGTATSVEVWMVKTPGALLTTDAAVRGAGERIWGPVALGANASVQIDWNTSAKLFTGRQALVDEIKGDGRFDLYALGSGSYSFRLDNGALVVVVSAKK